VKEPAIGNVENHSTTNSGNEQKATILDSPATTPKTTKPKTKKIQKRTLQDLNQIEINENNDDYETKYPTKFHGVIIKSDNLNDKKCDSFDSICDEITQQTGAEKYAIVEASVVHDLTKKIFWLVLKIDDHDDYKVIRDIGNWSQRSFGGTILSLTPMPLTFIQNNFENYLDLMITVPAKMQITLQMVKKCKMC